MGKQMWNFKARCVRNDSDLCQGMCKVGDIFEFKNGQATWSNREKSCRYESIEDLNKRNPTLKFDLVTEPKQFTKADLRTGMRVETKDGTRYIVFVEIKKLSNGRNWLGLDGISEDLTDKHNADDYSIFRVFDSPFNPAYLINVNEVGKLLYQRIEPTYITIPEAEAMLTEVEGKEIKIRKE